MHVRLSLSTGHHLPGTTTGVQCWAGPPRPCRMIWNPTRAFIESTNVWRFMQRLGFEDRETFLRFSRENPERFWDEMMREMRVEWFEPYRQVLDASRGPEWAQWFTGGRLNIAHNCLDRWAEIRSRRLPLGRRERRDRRGHFPRGPRPGQPRGQRTARARPRGRRPRGAVHADGPGDPRHPLRLLQGRA